MRERFHVVLWRGKCLQRGERIYISNRQWLARGQSLYFPFGVCCRSIWRPGALSLIFSKHWWRLTVTSPKFVLVDNVMATQGTGKRHSSWDGGKHTKSTLKRLQRRVPKTWEWEASDLEDNAHFRFNYVTSHQIFEWLNYFKITFYSRSFLVLKWLYLHEFGRSIKNVSLASVVIECTTIPLECKTFFYINPPRHDFPTIKVLNKCINKKIYK